MTMKTKPATHVRDDLSAAGRKLLRLLIEVASAPGFQLGDPSTYIGYRDCCDRLGLIRSGMDVPWGRLLQPHGLNDLNEWTKRHRLPTISGLIVNVSGDRAWYPGGDYFKSHGRPDPDFDWWEDEVAKAIAFNWKPYL
jgi:hypothetical protein